MRGRLRSLDFTLHVSNELLANCKHSGSLPRISDRLGVKPFFYALLDDGTLLFGSELKSVLAHGGLFGELAQAAGLSAPAMSRHLRTLRRSGLVEETSPDFDARVRVYQLRPEPMVHLLRWLEETERLWTTQLAAFRAHVEQAD